MWSRRGCIPISTGFSLEAKCFHFVWGTSLWTSSIQFFLIINLLLFLEFSIHTKFIVESLPAYIAWLMVMVLITLLINLANKCAALAPILVLFPNFWADLLLFLSLKVKSLTLLPLLCISRLHRFLPRCHRSHVFEIENPYEFCQYPSWDPHFFYRT